MSIKQQRTMTEKNLAAHRENARKSRGPVTSEGKDRRRDASLRHGFYSQDRDKALRALGEDPRDFDAMVKSVREKYEPADGFEEALAMRLARAMWRMDRADRMQEGYALRQAKDENNCREDRLHAQMMRLKMTGASLQSLAQAVARERYVTTPGHLDLMRNLQPDGAVKEMGEIALALFLQLQEPGERDKEGRHVDPNEAERRALAKFKEIFGLYDDGPHQVGQAAPPTPEERGSQVIETKKEEPYPNITAAQWVAREPVRQLLEHILTRQVEICEAQRLATLKECVAGPSPFERAAEIAPTHPNVALMQRMQDSSFREVWRLSNLLLKIKKQTRGLGRDEDDPESGNAPDKPAPIVGACPEQSEEAAQAVAPTGACPDIVDWPAPAGLKFSAPTPDPNLGREPCENRPESGGINDKAGTYGPSADPLSKAETLKSNKLNSGPINKKKDVKMEVYPDKSNRINRLNQPRRVVCGHRRSNRQFGRRKSPFVNRQSKIGNRQFPMTR